MTTEFLPLSDETWEAILERLFQVEGQSIKLKNYTLTDWDDDGNSIAVMQEVDIVQASELVRVMSLALRTIPTDSLNTLMWIAAQDYPEEISENDLSKRKYVDTYLGESVMNTMEDLVNNELNNLQIAERFCISPDIIELKRNNDF